MKTNLILTALFSLASSANAATFQSTSGITSIRDVDLACHVNLPASYHYRSRIGGRRVSGRFIAQNAFMCFRFDPMISGRFSHRLQGTHVRCSGNMEVQFSHSHSAMITWNYDWGQPQCQFQGGSLDSPNLWRQF